MFSINNLKLSTRMFIIGFIAVITVMALLMAGYFQLKKEKFSAKNVKTQQVVETAWSVLDHYAKLNKSGTLSLEEAQAAAKNTIRDMRYDNNEYFFIVGTNGTCVMHPTNPKLEGQDVKRIADTNGKYFFADMADVSVKRGSGFVEYFYEKPGEKIPSPKISFVKGFPDWNWFVASGIYVDDVQKELSRTFWTILAGGSVLLVIFIGIIFFMTRAIVRPINQITDDLNEASSTVTDASSQVAESSHILAEGTSEQAAALEETSSSLEELSSMTRQNAENAREVNTLMTATKSVVARSNESMAELTGSMRDIASASEETQKIITTIDEIAFQTNLLSLNAAVEAARAGEAGAGFAVVAEEVRNLALRTSEAAKNTSELIEKSVKRIHHGSDLVKKCNENFSEVSRGAEKVHSLVNEIAEAAAEQAEGINQISQAVNEMDTVTQRNSANAEESAAAAEELFALSGKLALTAQQLEKIVSGRSVTGTVRTVTEADTIHSRTKHKQQKLRFQSRETKLLNASGF